MDMAIIAAPAFTAPPQAQPWYRVMPPFAWFTQTHKPKRLRPAGHSAWVEAMHQPVLFMISLAFTSAGLYTLSKDYILKAASAIGAGDYGQIIPVSLALFVIVVTGGAIEIAFLTAASRLRMHLLRGEWGWSTVSGIMLLVTVSVEGLTCSYMFYLIEAPKLSHSWQLFMSSIPTLLFFVRAFAGLFCAAYLIIGVLPFVIRPDDVRREMAAEAGAAKVAIVQRLLHVINDLSVWQMLAIYEPVAAIFRDNAGYTSNQMSHRLVLESLADVRDQLKTTIATKSQQLGVSAEKLDPILAQVFDPMERSFQERGTGAELERYDEQTHAALTRLQERLQQPLPAQVDAENMLLTAQGHLSVQLATLQSDLRQQQQDTVGALRDEMLQALTMLQDQFRQVVDSLEDANGAIPAAAQSAPPRSPANPIVPKPGTKRFAQLVYETAQRLLTEGQLSIYNIAQAVKVDPQVIQATLTSLKQERLRKLRPGMELEPDPILDSL